MLELEPVERRAMELLLAGELPKLGLLRQQFESCRVIRREFTGVGFFTHFQVHEARGRLPEPERIVIGDVNADVEGLEFGCGFILFVEEGLLATLECHLWGDDAFPPNPRYTQLYYIDRTVSGTVEKSAQRDLMAIKTKLD